MPWGCKPDRSVARNISSNDDQTDITYRDELHLGISGPSSHHEFVEKRHDSEIESELSVTLVAGDCGSRMIRINEEE